MTIHRDSNSSELSTPVFNCVQYLYQGASDCYQRTQPLLKTRHSSVSQIGGRIWSQQTLKNAAPTEDSTEILLLTQPTSCKKPKKKKWFQTWGEKIWALKYAWYTHKPKYPNLSIWMENNMVCIIKPVAGNYLPHFSLYDRISVLFSRACQVLIYG